MTTRSALADLVRELAQMPGGETTVPVFDRHGDLVLRVVRGEIESLPAPKADVAVSGPGTYIEDEREEREQYRPGGATDWLRLEQPLNGWDDFFQLWLSNPTVSACVQIISQAMRYGGWELAPAQGADGKPIAQPSEADGAALHAFFSSCHPYLSMDQILGSILPALVLANRYLSEIAFNQIANERTPYGRQPGAIYPIPSQGRMRARLDEKGLFQSPAWAQLRQNTSQVGGAQKKPIYFDWEQILWLQLAGIVQRGIFTVSPVEMLRVPIGTNIHAGQYLHSFFTSGGKIGLVFTLPQGVANSKSIAESWARYISKAFSSSKTGFKSIVLHSGMTVDKAPSADKSGVELLDIQKFNRDDICAVFGVDPRLVAQERGGNLGGKGEREQAWYELITNAVLPRVKTVEEAITKQVIRQGFGITDWDFRLKSARINTSEESREIIARVYEKGFDLGIFDSRRLDDLNAARAELNPELAPLADLPASKAQLQPIYQYDLEAGDITINEHRGAKGLPPVSGGDAFVEFIEPVAPVAGQVRVAGSLFVRRFDTRRAKSMLADYEAELAAVVRDGLDSITGKLGKKLAEIYPAISLASARDDAAAAKALQKIDNFAPGGGPVIVDARKLMKGFFEKTLAATKEEVAALMKKAARAQLGDMDEEILTGGDVGDFIDLASDEFFDEVFGDLKGIAKKTFREGLSAGWSRKDFVQALTDKFGFLSETLVSTVVRTQATDFYNLARERVFKGSGGAVETVVFSAIIDDATTAVCLKLDNVTFRGLDDPALDAARPPLHWQCRSVLLPIMVGEEWEPTPKGRVQSAMKLIQVGFGKRSCAEHDHGV